MAEGARLESVYTGQAVSRVRIPLSPPVFLLSIPRQKVTDFLCEFGDMYEQYYCSLESVFSNALKLMKTFKYQEVISFEQRLHVVVKKAEHMGWGYYDAISDMLNEAYPTP